MKDKIECSRHKLGLGTTFQGQPKSQRKWVKGVCLSHPTYYLLNLPCIPERYMMRTELGESLLTFLLNLERGTLLPILLPLQLRNSGNSS